MFDLMPLLICYLHFFYAILVCFTGNVKCMNSVQVSIIHICDSISRLEIACVYIFVTIEFYVYISTLIRYKLIIIVGMSNNKSSWNAESGRI